MKEKKDDKADKILLYLKMFMGMGFFWILEIAAGLSGDDVPDAAWYFFDGINTLQGLWVFVIFVCKQNVINHLHVTAGMRESERSKSRTTNMQMKRMKKNNQEKWKVDDSRKSEMSESGATCVSTVL